MGFLSPLIGGGVGVGVQMYANAVQKVPLSRYPWMHAFMFATGCYAGAKYPKAEKALVERINERRTAKGLSPLIGTTAWIRYQPKE